MRDQTNNNWADEWRRNKESAPKKSRQSQPEKHQKAKPGKRELSVYLQRPVTAKRYPIIATITFNKERADLVSILKAVQSGKKMPPRLMAYLKREKLYEEDSSKLSSKGEQVIQTGRLESSERGLYYIWYTNNDALLTTRPLLIQRDTAFFEPDNITCWKKGSDASHSEFSVNTPYSVEAVEETYDRGKTTQSTHTLPVLSINAEVIGESDKATQLTMNWALKPNVSNITLSGSLDRREFKQNKKADIPHTIELTFSDLQYQFPAIMDNIALALNGDWNTSKQRAQTNLESIEKYSQAVQDFSISNIDFHHHSIDDLGKFYSIKVSHLPIMPADESDAKQWQQTWLQDYHAKQYQSAKQARKQQASWLDHPAIADFDLALMSGSALLNNFKRESSPKAFWHVAAITDLSPSQSKQLQLPITLINDEKIDLHNLVERLTNDSDITHVIYSDRYVRTTKQKHNFTAIADLLPYVYGSLYTLEPMEDLPSHWFCKTFEKKPDNHGRYWIFKGMDHTYCWECSNSLDFINMRSDESFVSGSTTFTPKEVKELPDYLQHALSEASL